MRIPKRLSWSSTIALLTTIICGQVIFCLGAWGAKDLAKIRKDFLAEELRAQEETIESQTTSLTDATGMTIFSNRQSVGEKSFVADQKMTRSIINSATTDFNWKQYNGTTSFVPQSPLTQYLGAATITQVLNNIGPPDKPLLPHLFYPGGIARVLIPPGYYKDVLPIITKGGPVSDAEFAILSQKAAILQADGQLDLPLETVKAKTHSEMQGVLDTGGQVAQQSFTAGLAELTKPIPNPSAANPSNPGLQKVNKMYFAFFLPLAILLLLPGAAASSTQFIMRNAGLLQVGNDNVFSFLQRPLIALFMMAACPLFVGIAIDVGNAMTSAVASNLDEQAILQWFESNTNKLSLAPPPGGVTPAAVAGVATGTASTSAVVDTAMSASQALKGAVMNTSSALLTNAVQILTVFQLVLVAYLYVMGPIACAMWVYPDSNIAYFRRALGSWLNGIICLVLWKFVWAVILLCIQSRLTWLKEIGAPAGDADWESFMLVAFLTLLAIAPAACFSFNPGSYVDAVLAKAKQMSKGKGAASSLSSMGI